MLDSRNRFDAPVLCGHEQQLGRKDPGLIDENRYRPLQQGRFEPGQFKQCPQPLGNRGIGHENQRAATLGNKPM